MVTVKASKDLYLTHRGPVMLYGIGDRGLSPICLLGRLCQAITWTNVYLFKKKCTIRNNEISFII